MLSQDAGKDHDEFHHAGVLRAPKREAAVQALDTCMDDIENLVKHKRIRQLFRPGFVGSGRSRVSSKARGRPYPRPNPPQRFFSTLLDTSRRRDHHRHVHPDEARSPLQVLLTQLRDPV